MRAPEFWHRTDVTARLEGLALAPLGWLYGASVARKAARAKPFRARAKVVCIGNLTVGGSGKTPIAIAVAQALAARQLRVAFLSRGYGGKIRAPSFVDLNMHTAADVGDEALMLATVAPAIVARDRAAGARLADEAGIDVLVMDDGHQNFTLAKDLSVVVVDARSGFGNGRVVPAGPLREPVAQGLKRADAVVMVGGEGPALDGVVKPVLRAEVKPTGAVDLAGRRVIAFAGIGAPQKFFATLRALGAEIVDARAYADHHAYSAAEIARLKARARDHGAVLITTEKDFVRLAPIHREGIDVLAVRAVFDDPAALMDLLERSGVVPPKGAS